jgi:sugar phosphate permease
MGIFNSAIFPNFISIMSNWFPKKNRGALVGFWATANNFGNIVGIQLASWLMKVFDGKWQFLLLIIGVFLFGVAILNLIFLVPEPEMIGIEID